jgi:uncharacterized repeat protein (TIGR03833 family)
MQPEICSPNCANRERLRADLRPPGNVIVPASYRRLTRPSTKFVAGKHEQGESCWTRCAQFGMDHRKRADIKIGARVRVVQKQDQRSGRLTEGTVLGILTNSASHPHGIKVRLESGVVGRVKEIK